MSDAPRPKKLPADPRLAALWQATSTSERYWIDDEHHVFVKGRGIIPLAAAAKRQEATGAAS